MSASVYRRMISWNRWLVNLKPEGSKSKKTLTTMWKNVSEGAPPTTQKKCFLHILLGLKSAFVIFFFFCSLFCTLILKNNTCRFKSHSHLVGAHGARFVHVKLPEYSLDMGRGGQETTSLNQITKWKHQCTSYSLLTQSCNLTLTRYRLIFSQSTWNSVRPNFPVPSVWVKTLRNISWSERH